jgi:hypothetical protein
VVVALWFPRGLSTLAALLKNITARAAKAARMPTARAARSIGSLMGPLSKSSNRRRGLNARSASSLEGATGKRTSGIFSRPLLSTAAASAQTGVIQAFLVFTCGMERPLAIALHDFR